MSGTWEIRQGDCLEAMAEMPEASVDAIVTDPPYGLEFMGKEWDRLDHGLPQENVWKGRRGKGGSNIGTDDSKPASRHHVALGMGKRHQYKRCTTCGKRQFSGSPCKCGDPEWVLETPLGPPSSSVRAQRWHQAWATEALRVLKPGGHLLAFGGTRTSHRLVCAIEDAGFEIRDTICWLYGSGFPKSLDVGKAIDKAAPRVGMFEAFAEHYGKRRLAVGLNHYQVCEAIGAHGAVNHGGASTNWEQGHNVPTLDQWQGLAPLLDLSPKWLPLIERVEAERDVIGRGKAVFSEDTAWSKSLASDYDITAPATPEAEQWNGWGTALKPAHEPVVVARKPLTGTVAANVLEHGTGALNVDGCRVAHSEGNLNRGGSYGGVFGNGGAVAEASSSAGRWPANVVLDEEAAGMLDEQTGERRSAGEYAKGSREQGSKDGAASIPIDGLTSATYSDSGGSSRFFYVAKASRAERNAGLEGFEESLTDDGREISIDNPYLRGETTRRNVHPTVKPLALMRWLVRLVTPPGGTVLDPFTGSGTTGCAAVLEGFDFIGLEREAEYVEIAKARLAYWADPAKAEVALALERAALEREAEDRRGGPVQLVLDTGEEAA